MHGNIHAISYLGVILEIAGISMLLPILVGGLFGDGVYFPFLIAAVLSFVLGSFLDRRFAKGDLDFGSIMLLASMSLVVVSLIGAIPYLFFLPPLDAVFESISGFTTTGLTAVLPEQLPKSIIFWRSMTQWLGGLGALFFFVLTLSRTGISSYHLYRSEGNERIDASAYRKMTRMGLIYLSYTGLGVALFALAGMPVFDAVAHSFSTVSTGGFSTRNDSLASFGSPLVNAVAFLLMVLGATSFVLHDKLWRRDFISYLWNQEARLFWILFAAFSVLLLVSGSGIGSLFHAASALTTTGLTVSSLDAGSGAFLIIILMLIGGFACSPAGGLKLTRVFVAAKGVWWHSKKLLLPREAVVPLKIGATSLATQEILDIFFFVLTYLALLGISAAALSLMGYPLLVSFFQAASAQGTVGLSLVPVAAMPAAAKAVLIFSMLLGRLEIFPFLAFLVALSKVRRH
jgi:trk system potassium uptake protein TrkH